ncbi:alkyl sulfatase C-terminal domain-containing protein [Streptomyces sp. NPDC002787]
MQRPVGEMSKSTLRITHTALADLAYGASALDDIITEDTATVDGDRTDIDTLLSLLDTFNGTFDIVAPNLRQELVRDGHAEHSLATALMAKDHDRRLGEAIEDPEGHSHWAGRLLERAA